MKPSDGLVACDSPFSIGSVFYLNINLIVLNRDLAPNTTNHDPHKSNQKVNKDGSKEVQKDSL